MVKVGDIVHLHDWDTTASKKDVMRWCMVVGITGSTARVAPRSASKSGKVFTSAELMDAFTRDGCFSRWSLPVPVSLLESVRNIGQLPEPERSQVLSLFHRRREK
jgi:hypothetical protein